MILCQLWNCYLEYLIWIAITLVLDVSRASAEGFSPLDQRFFSCVCGFGSIAYGVTTTLEKGNLTTISAFPNILHATSTQLFLWCWGFLFLLLLLLSWFLLDLPSQLYPKSIPSSGCWNPPCHYGWRLSLDDSQRWPPSQLGKNVDHEPAMGQKNLPSLKKLHVLLLIDWYLSL